MVLSVCCIFSRVFCFPLLFEPNVPFVHPIVCSLPQQLPTPPYSDEAGGWCSEHQVRQAVHKVLRLRQAAHARDAAIPHPSACPHRRSCCRRSLCGFRFSPAPQRQQQQRQQRLFARPLRRWRWGWCWGWRWGWRWGWCRRCTVHACVPASGDAPGQPCRPGRSAGDPPQPWSQSRSLRRRAAAAAARHPHVRVWVPGVAGVRHQRQRRGQRQGTVVHNSVQCRRRHTHRASENLDSPRQLAVCHQGSVHSQNRRAYCCMVFVGVAAVVFLSYDLLAVSLCPCVSVSLCLCVFASLHLCVSVSLCRSVCSKSRPATPTLVCSGCPACLRTQNHTDPCSTPSCPSSWTASTV